MKVILIERQRETSTEGCVTIVGVASNMDMVDIMLGRMVREGKLGYTGHGFRFLEVEVDVDLQEHYSGNVGKEIKEIPAKTTDPWHNS